MQRLQKVGVLGLSTLLLGAFFYFDLGQYLTLDVIKSKQTEFAIYYAQNPVLTIGTYLLIYIVSTALSLPGAALLSLLGGALFGLARGTVLVSFASTIGATLAFLASRFLLREWVQKRFFSYLERINKGIVEEGAFYLFTLRLIPAIPFFVINLVMGLTPMKIRTFFVVSQAGMLAGTFVYVNAGTQLAQVDSLQGILSPYLLLSFIVLGLFPLMTKKVITALQKKR